MTYIYIICVRVILLYILLGVVRARIMHIMSELTSYVVLMSDKIHISPGM